MKSPIAIAILVGLFCFSAADVSVTVTVYDSSSCDQSIRTIGPNTIPSIASCSDLPLPSTCALDTCCAGPLGMGSVMTHCEESSTETDLPSIDLPSSISDIPQVCSQLEVAAKALCQKNGVCVDSSPSTTCCGALKVWSLSGCDTSSIRPTGFLSSVCSYKPQNASQYYNSKCSNTVCQPVTPVLDAVCGDVTGCPTFVAITPSQACCSAANMMNLASGLSECKMSSTNGCPAVSVSQIVSMCEQNTPATTSPAPATTSPAPATASPVPTSTVAIDNLTECQRQALDASAPPMMIRFRPRCEPDGSFSPMQCSGSTGYCWCVNESGVKLPGTDASPIQPRPDCTRAVATTTSAPTSSSTPAPTSSQASRTPAPTSTGSTDLPSVTSEPMPVELEREEPRGTVRPATAIGAAVGGIICVAAAVAILFRSRSNRRVNASLSHIQAVPVNASVAHIQAIPVKTTTTIDVPVV